MKYATTVAETVVPFGKRPIVAFTHRAAAKQDALVAHFKTEVAWLGTVIQQENVYIIDDIILPKQEVSGATAEIDEVWLSDWTNAMLAQPGGIDVLSRLFYWGHSHVDMQTGPSGTDNDTMVEMAGNSAVFIRGIFNKRGEAHITLADYANGLIYTGMPAQIVPDQLWVDEVMANAALVSEAPRVSAYTGYGLYGGKGSAVKKWYDEDNELPLTEAPKATAPARTATGLVFHDAQTGEFMPGKAWWALSAEDRATWAVADYVLMGLLFDKLVDCNGVSAAEYAEIDTNFDSYIDQIEEFRVRIAPTKGKKKGRK